MIPALPEEPGKYSDVVQAVASHCCVCRRRLTDASSVQNGIGPICSAKYYSDAHISTEDQILHGTGSLMASDLPMSMVDAVLAQIDRQRTRKACNILVYYASARYQDRETVFQIASIIRDFGYGLLAEKLEQDRTKVQLHKDKDPDGNLRLILDLKNEKWEAQRELRTLAGHTRTRKKGRHFCWTFPEDALEMVECILGWLYGDVFAQVSVGIFGSAKQGITRIPRQSWADLQALRSAALPPTSSTGSGTTVRIVDQGGRFQFFSPYNSVWLTEMKSCIRYKDRAWNGSCWMFSSAVLPVVKRLAKIHYSVDL